MRVVLDASIVAAWVLPDENAAEAARVMVALPSTGGVVPPVWPFEIRNTFLSAERRNRIDPAMTRSFIGAILRLPIDIDVEANFDEMLALAQAHRLTIYDAAYLELAKRTGSPLATLDAALRKAATSVGVALA